MRYQLFTPAERSRSATVAEFAMGSPRVETWGEEEEFDPETIPCRECDGHGLATETYDGLGRYSRTDCYVCNGEGRVPNRLTGDY